MRWKARSTSSIPGIVEAGSLQAAAGWRELRPVPALCCRRCAVVLQGPAGPLGEMCEAVTENLAATL